jgi:surface protein
MTNTPSPTAYGPPLIFVVQTNAINQQVNLGFMDEGTYSGVIDWGDGIVSPMSSALSGLHTYTAIGTYEVKVYGTIIGLQIGALPQSQRLRFKEVKQWGTVQAYNNSFSLMFGNSPNLVLTGVTDVLNLQGVTSTTFMFGSSIGDNTSITTINRIGEWDVSSVITFERMFSRINQFNDDLSSWNVSAATNMIGMFYSINNFDRDISSWDVSNVTNMDFMFTESSSFNQDLSSWCVSLIPIEPTSFDTDASSWVLPRPIWGTCP